MPTFAATLKSEISRIARKESRALAAPLHRASTQYRRDVAALKRQVTRLTKQVAFLEGQERGRVAKPALSAPSNAKARFSPLWLKKHRTKLDLSAGQYAKLAGASAQSVYFWESGRINVLSQSLIVFSGPSLPNSRRSPALAVQPEFGNP